jgi:putative effector of murein hydrolase
VALAVPLYRQFDKVRRSAFGIFVSLLVGSLTAAVSAVVIVALLGGNREAMISVVPKSVTAPVAMGITEKLGGLPSLTAVLVILTGIIGASLGPPLMNALGIKAWEARGFAIGVASHGIGTARALEVNELAGAFSGLAMGLNAMLASVILPLLWRVFT